METLKQLHKKYSVSTKDSTINNIFSLPPQDQFIEFTECDVEIDLMIYDFEKQLHKLKNKKGEKK